MRIKTIEVIEIDGERYYQTSAGDFPSVNTVLSATMSPEKKQAIAIWRRKQQEKWVTKNRRCNNCDHHTGNECALGLTGQKVKHPWKSNRCQQFELVPQLAAHDPGTEARDRGTRAHEHVQKFFESGVMPTPEEFPQGKQIKFLLENLLPGKLLVEQALVSTKHRYAGRVDFVGEYEGHTTVFDWTTTSRTYVEKSYYADKLTQAAAYAIAIEEQYGFHVDTVAVVVMGPRKAVMFKDPAAQWKTAWLQRLEAFKLQELPF